MPSNAAARIASEYVLSGLQEVVVGLVDAAIADAVANARPIHAASREELERLLRVVHVTVDALRSIVDERTISPVSQFANNVLDTIADDIKWLAKYPGQSAGEDSPMKAREYALALYAGHVVRIAELDRRITRLEEYAFPKI